MRDTAISAFCDDVMLLVEPMGLRPQRWLAAVVVFLGALLLSLALDERPVGSDQADRVTEPTRAVAALESRPTSF